MQHTLRWIPAVLALTVACADTTNDIEEQAEPANDDKLLPIAPRANKPVAGYYSLVSDCTNIPVAQGGSPTASCRLKEIGSTRVISRTISYGSNVSGKALKSGSLVHTLAPEKGSTKIRVDFVARPFGSSVPTSAPVGYYVVRPGTNTVSAALPCTGLGCDRRAIGLNSSKGGRSPVSLNRLSEAARAAYESQFNGSPVGGLGAIVAGTYAPGSGKVSVTQVFLTKPTVTNGKPTAL